MCGSTPRGSTEVFQSGEWLVTVCGGLDGVKEVAQLKLSQEVQAIRARVVTEFCDCFPTPSRARVGGLV